MYPRDNHLSVEKSLARTRPDWSIDHTYSLASGCHPILFKRSRTMEGRQRSTSNRIQNSYRTNCSNSCSIYRSFAFEDQKLQPSQLDDQLNVSCTRYWNIIRIEIFQECWILICDWRMNLLFDRIRLHVNETLTIFSSFRLQFSLSRNLNVDIRSREISFSLVNDYE